MVDRKLYELVNPSDYITFKATPLIAAIIGTRIVGYFVKDIETGAAPDRPDDLMDQYEALWRDGAAKASYADAWASFLIGSPEKRRLFEEAISRMPEGEVEAFKADYHDRNRTSINDICRRCWEVADKVREMPVEAAHG